MKNKIIATTLAGGLLLTMVTTTIVSGADAGSSGDPLVTKSYVDAKINDLKALVIGNTTTTENTTPTTDSQYKVVVVPKGSSIVGGEGTEMILRSGKASVVSPNANGIVNMTKGVDATSGSDVPKNNLMIIPREDGRGLEVSVDANVMVRGYYQIIQ